MKLMRLANRRRSAAAQRSLLACVALATILFLSLTSLGYRYLVPHYPAGSVVTGPRTGWYITSAQWRADARTLLSIVRYLAEPGGSRPALLESETNDVAAAGGTQASGSV